MDKDQFLKKNTDHDSKYWVARVQALVWESIIEDSPAQKFGFQIHPDCDPGKWVAELTDEIIDSLPKETKFDENIVTAKILAIILVCWGYRIANAKGMDPNRPLKIRRAVMRRQKDSVLALLDALTDPSQDYDYFPQEFNFPFGPGARGGDFI